MTHAPVQIATATEPSPYRVSRWIDRRWSVYAVVIGIGYLSRVLSADHLTLVQLLLLTAIYGAWLIVFQRGWRSPRQASLWCVSLLVCLACASQFIALSRGTLNWLPILTTTTACLIAAANTPMTLGLIASGLLWMSSSLAFTIILRQWNLGAQLTLLLSFSSFVGVSVAIRKLTQAQSALERSNAELAQAHAQLQEYSAQVEEIGAIRERNRIAREIHDTLGHSLTLLAVQLETAAQFEARSDPGLHEELLAARRVAKSCLSEVRQSVGALRPDAPSGDSLPDRLRALVAESAATFRETTITLDLDEATAPLSQDVARTLYRCAQEALTNMRKHAHASKALVYLSTVDEPEPQVELSVLDNGQGATAWDEERAPGFGLLGMRERVTLLNGALKVGPEPGHGWRVDVVIPLRPRKQAMIITPTPHEASEAREA